VLRSPRITAWASMIVLPFTPMLSLPQRTLSFDTLLWRFVVANEWRASTQSKNHTEDTNAEDQAKLVRIRPLYAARPVD
jgi:hypothetical protein